MTLQLPCSCLIYHCFACSGHLLKPEEAKWFSFVQPKTCTVCRNVVGTHEVTHTCALAIIAMLHVNAQQLGDWGDARTCWLTLVTFASRHRYTMLHNVIQWYTNMTNMYNLILSYFATHDVHVLICFGGQMCFAALEILGYRCTVRLCPLLELPALSSLICSNGRSKFCATFIFMW